MKKHTYKATWHDGGMFVMRSDGRRACFQARRSDEELNRMTEREMFATLRPAKGWRRFEK